MESPGQLKVVKRGDPPPCIEQTLLCRGCFGWKSMVQAAKDIPLWKKYPFACECTGLTVKYVAKDNEEEEK